jgi:hypothetical protein
MPDNLQIAPRQTGAVTWVETLALTTAVVGLGYWSEPTDPLLAFSGFAWSLFAPLLLSLRYGFFHGLVSALLLLAVMLALHFTGYGDYQTLPSHYLVGVLAVGMVSGEFRDLWGRRLDGLQRANDYREMRLDEFTRAHHILRISHDRLEQKVAGNDHSLRSVLLAMRQRMAGLEKGQDNLVVMAEAILDLFSNYGPLRQAALYRVEDNTLSGKAMSMLGEMDEISDSDPLVRLTLQQAELISLRPELLEQGGAVTTSPLLAGIPLLDTHGKIHALVLVQQMPFFAFNDRNLNLLAILGGHIADLLANQAQASLHSDVDAQRFAQLCLRSLTDAKRYDIPGYLLGLELKDPAWAQDVSRLLHTQQRGLDVIWALPNARGNTMVLVLLPLTAEDGLRGYLERIRMSLLENIGMSLEVAGVHVHRHPISRSDNVKRLGQFLQQECALNEFEVVIH